MVSSASETLKFEIANEIFVMDITLKVVMIASRNKNLNKY